MRSVMLQINEYDDDDDDDDDDDAEQLHQFQVKHYM